MANNDSPFTSLSDFGPRSIFNVDIEEALSCEWPSPAIQSITPPLMDAVLVQAQGPSSIFDRFPVEVVAIIFTFYAANLAPKTSPLTLGTICSRWRLIAWSTPAVWSTLSTHFDRPRALTENRLQLIEDWLARSGTLPLSISIEITEIYGPRQLRRMRRLIRILNRHCAQWYDLALDMPHAALVDLGDVNNLPSNLHRLSLCPWAPTHTHNPNLKFGIPVLSRLSPEIVEIQTRYLDPLKLDWTRITTFKVSSIPLASLFQILKVGANLRECHAGVFNSRMSGHDYVSPEELKPVIHRQLQTLQISSAETSYRAMGLFFLFAILPGLGHLCPLADQGGVPIDELISFLARSASHLRVLSIEETECGPPTNIVKIMRLLPCLEELHITEGSPYSQRRLEPFFRAMTANSPSVITPKTVITPPLLPRLKMFDWSGEGVFNWHYIPKLFWPLSLEDNAVRRPLEVVRVRCRLEEREQPRCIPANVASQLRDFSEVVEFDFRVEVGCSPSSCYRISLDGKCEKLA